MAEAGEYGQNDPGKLEEILKRLDETPVEVRGSGRTDAGVHALAQVADFRLNREMAPRDVMEYLNRYLPEDIGVWKIEKAPERFHSRLNAVRKTYRYQIEMGPKKDVFQRGYYYGLGLELDVKAMEQAADLLTGTRDFKSFCGNKKMKKSTCAHWSLFNLSALEIQSFIYHLPEMVFSSRW